MKTLFELVKYNSNNLKIVELLMPPNQTSPLKKLYSIVISKKFINDTQAMKIIYGRKNLSTFSRLKTRLKDILIKATLLQNSNFETKHSRVTESMNQFRHTIAAKFFVDLKANSLSTEIAERALVKAIKYHSTENILILSRLLIRHFGSVEYNKLKLSKYLSIQEKYLRINSWEIKAENYFYDLQNTQLISSATPSKLSIEKAKNYVDELDKVDDIKSYLFFINRYKVKAAYYEYMKDYESILNLSEATIKELSVPDLRTNVSMRNINIRKVLALIQVGRNDEALKITSRDLKNLPTGSLPWYLMAYFKLKVLLYDGTYNNAVDLIKVMIEDPHFPKLSINHKDLFYTTLGYMHLIIDSGLAGDREKYHKKLPEFKIGKFLNTTPIFSKDKRGINISILLMHIAILLQRKNYNAIIDRIDSLKQYAHKYLRNDDTFRSNCMVKMVVQMTKANFHPIRTERYTRDLLKQLEQVKLAGSGENVETEIIPNEVLWSIMLKALK
ncbi:MAG TPA: hypothetical protein VFG10_11690 [Saprospiraceae bacterium]|nr:hypothetical protein [Saprospiraceae bacterium]